MKNKILIGACSGVLALSLVITGATCTAYAKKGDDTKSTEKEEKTVSSESEEAIDSEELVSSLFANASVESREIGKDETVYIITDSTGKVSTTIVSDHLVNADGAASLDDISNLSDIVNVKGDETFTANGSKLTWAANGNDIYYQGTTTNAAPVSQTITYYLDGKEVSFDELKGASGKVTIRFDYTNNASYSETLNGKEYTVYVPFVAMSALVLDDGFENITVTNGKLTETGSGTVVIGYALPGLADSLAIDEMDLDADIEIPDYFEVSADVTDFDLSVAMTLVANAGSYISTGELSLDSLDDVIDTLTDATSQLEEGSATLADGMDDLYDGLKSYLEGAVAINDGLNTLNASTGALADGVTALDDGADSLAAGAATLANGASTLANGAGTLSNGANTLASGLGQLNASGATIQTYMLLGIQSSMDAQLNTVELAALWAQLGLTADSNGRYVTTANVAAVASAVAENEATIEQALMVAGMTKAAPEGLGLTQAQAVGILTATAYYQAGDMANFGATLAGIPMDVPTYQGYAAYLPTIQAGAVATYNTLLSGINTAAAGVAAANALPANITALYDGANQLAAGAGQLTEGANTLATGAKTLSDGAATLAAGTQSLLDKTPDLVNGITLLTEGSNTLVSNNEKLLDGASQLAEGAHTLADGIVTFNEEGIQAIVDAYNGDVTDVFNRLTVVLNAAESYGAFTDAADGVNASAKFIYKVSFN